MEPSDTRRTTTTIDIREPRLEIAGRAFPRESIRTAQLHFHRDDFSEYRSATIAVSPPPPLRWDYHDEAKLYEDSELIFTGTCSAAQDGENGTLQLALSGALSRLEKTKLASIETFGMEPKEIIHWVVRLNAPALGPHIPGLQLNTTLRPFMYAIPLKGLEGLAKGVLPVGDGGIAARRDDNIFGPILEQAESVKTEDAWGSENPLIFGIVAAHDMIEAERLALERANLMTSIVNLALTTGMSHFETRYECDALQFNADDGLSPVSLYPWVIIREVSELKGWIRKTTDASVTSEKRPDALEKIALFLSRFFGASQAGDIHEQIGRRAITGREKRLLTGVQRSLHWLNNAVQEDDLRDRFTATWIGLEAILNAIAYPGVFQEERSSVKAAIKSSIRSLILPDSKDPLLKLDRNMISNWALRGHWSPSRKLAIFGRVFGIALQSGDEDLVRRLGRTRASIFHEGEESPHILPEDVTRLRYLVQRLVAGATIGGYEDLEDKPHTFEIGEIGPEGGAAPLAIDGRDVPYELRMFRDGGGQLVAEWIAEGKIHTEENIKFAKQGSES